MTPTALSLRLLRRRGFLADVVERFIAHPAPGRRKDLFGAFDLLAFAIDLPGMVGVQTTALGCLSARIAKLRSLPAVDAWVRAGHVAELHGWAKRDGRWRVKIVQLQAGDMQPVIVESPRRRLRQTRSQGDLFTGLE